LIKLEYNVIALIYVTAVEGFSCRLRIDRPKAYS